MYSWLRSKTMIKNKNVNDFYKVSLTNAERRNYLFWGLLVFSFCTFFPVVWLMSDIQNKIVFSGGSSVIANIIAVLIFALYVFMLVFLWKKYLKFKKQGTRNKPSKEIIEGLQYFIEANKLYETKKDSLDRTVIAKSVTLGYAKPNDEVFIIRAYKHADKFDRQLSELDNQLSALTGFPLDNKKDTITYTDYIFRTRKFERIVVECGTANKNKSTLISLNSELNWNVLKQPHMLLAGVTGSGKTTFLNYLILEMKKMNADVYVCDPKRSDLSSLQHYWGKEYVASDTNNIARLTRELKDIMDNRFIEYKENAENFVYGNSYVDYGLKPVFILFDELGAFRAGADKKVFSETMANLTEIILKGREMGVFAILSTQQPNANNIPTELRDNLSVRLALGNMSNEAYRMVFGETEGLQTISEKGAGYIYLDGLGWEKPKYFEAPYLDYKKFNFIEEIKKYN